MATWLYDSVLIIQVSFNTICTLYSLRVNVSVPTGFWLFHCHFQFHILIGMNLVFHIGTQADLPPVPEGFPTCGHHLPPINYHWNWPPKSCRCLQYHHIDNLYTAAMSLEAEDLVLYLNLMFFFSLLNAKKPMTNYLWAESRNSLFLLLFELSSKRWTDVNRWMYEARSCRVSSIQKYLADNPLP